MPYPVELLTTVEDCDLVLAEAAEELGEIQYRQTQLNRFTTIGTGRATELTNELSGATSEYNNLAAILPGMAEGPTKKKNMREFKRLEYQIYLLNDKKTSGDSGPLALIKRRYELNCLTLATTENATLTTEVQARKTALQTP